MWKDTIMTNHFIGVNCYWNGLFYPNSSIILLIGWSDTPICQPVTYYNDQSWIPLPFVQLDAEGSASFPPWVFYNTHWSLLDNSANMDME